MWRLSSGSPSCATRSHAILPGPLVDRVDHPALARSIVGRVAVAVQAGPERRVRLAADRARDEDPVAPDDRARMREARDRRAPEDVLALRAVPAIGQVLSVGDAGRAAARGTTASCPRSGAAPGAARAPAPRVRTMSALGIAHGLVRRTPRAAIENHPPRRAGVGDEVERDVPPGPRSRDSAPALSQPPAASPAVRISISPPSPLPRALERRPAD